MRSLPSVVSAADMFLLLLLLEERMDIQLFALSQSTFMTLLEQNVNMMNRQSRLSQGFFFCCSLSSPSNKEIIFSRVVLNTCLCACVCVFTLQQAFNATAVIRHMRRLQLGTSTEGPNPNLLLPDEDAGTCLPQATYFLPPRTKIPPRCCVFFVCVSHQRAP